MPKVLARTGLVALVLLLAIQLVPYGWRHPNPPVTQAAVWSDPDAEVLARGACYDCHSNETDWPPYSFVAPMSWLVRKDVEDGRKALNLSELDQDGGDELDEAAETIAEGSMPPSQYELLHPAARLSDAERQRLIAAFEQLDGDDGGDGDNRGPG
jgi:hypothetical protein